MKKITLIWVLLLSVIIPIACSDDDNFNDNRIDIPTAKDTEVQDFIWQGLNLFYLWQEDVPNLADNKIDDPTTYASFLGATPYPVDFFEKLIYEPSKVDYWSWIVEDYVALENSFAGISKSNGVDFGLGLFSGTDNIFGYVRYILPNSDASDKNIKRGDLFTTVNGIELTRSNYKDLLFDDSIDTYTLDLSKVENNTVVSTGVSVELTKSEYTENPVFITNIIEENGHKIGYLMYNSFTANFDDDLNDAFLQFKNEGISDLVLDFRYNPGGRVSTANSMASMITGQFKDKLFSQEFWNSKLQAEIENSNPEWLFSHFSDKMENGNPINSLNLNKVHIIISGSTASASELIINGLNPYINVRLVGSTTVGKYVGSVTLYDSENFSKDKVNPNHTYAMQPIVLQMVNKLGENNKNGFSPHIALRESLENMGILGNSDEPLFRAAINDITGIAQKKIPTKNIPYQTITNTKLHTMLKDNMFVDKKGLLDFLKRTSLD